MFIEWRNRELFVSIEMKWVAKLILCPEFIVASICVDILLDPPSFLHDVRIKTIPASAKECHGVEFLSLSIAQTCARS
jgi:hypothetical protein